GQAAVKGVSLSVKRRQTYGLVGESGSGKSSAALAVMRLLKIESGAISLGGLDLTALQGRELRRERPKFQMIFQDPASSLNPRVRAEGLLTGPMALNGLFAKGQRLERAVYLLERVGLPASSLRLFPHQFSGGQRQRLVIARALSTGPSLVVADEPVSALDAAVQAQILNLLTELRENFGLTMLFISHDLGVIQHVCHQVGVMYRGRLVESAPASALFSAPAHPYTWALIAASVSDWALRDALSRVFGPGLESALIRSRESSAEALECDFPACPLREAACLKAEGSLTEVGPGHLSRCRLASEVRRQGRAVLELAEAPIGQTFTAAA
ncbi:MAG: ABC transporter ATP-binding protein, partial [Deltaproteobacteria bacterium]|nr:ABC transporter ATP-binding protein [Deltaproteobacteria bacterium]